MADSTIVKFSGDWIFTSAGVVAASAKLYVYDAGTGDLADIFSDADLASPLANPITADLGGLMPFAYIGVGAYKVVLHTASGVTIKTEDDIPGALDTSGLNATFAKPDTDIAVKTTDYSATTDDLGTIIVCNPTGGSFTVTLPSAVSAGNGRGITLKTIGTANIVTIATTSSQTIDGALTTLLKDRYSSLTVVSDGANWHIVHRVGDQSQVGEVKPYAGTTAPAGYVRANGRSISSSAGSGTELADDRTKELFALIWNSFANAECAVSGGRGASAAADFAANKTIALPDLRGRTFAGLDDMGNSAAGRLGNILTSPLVNGHSGGSERVTTTLAQEAQHDHGGQTASGAPTAPTYLLSNSSWAAAGGTIDTMRTTTAATPVSGSLGHLHNISAAGSGSPHSNMPPTWLGTFIIKL